MFLTDRINKIKHFITKRKKGIPEFRFSPTNPFAYITSDEDVFVFLKIIYDIETDGKRDISQEAMQLLWVLTDYLLHNCNKEDRTIENLIKLLNMACTPTSQRDEKNIFDIMVEECSEECPELVKKYEYFKYNVFGVYSNCYKRIVSECLEVLNGVSFEKVVEEQKKIKSDQRILSDTDKAAFFGFGELTTKKGQELQCNLYDKHLGAVHEAGHAVAHYLLKVDFYGATIIPADNTGGRIRFQNSDSISPADNAIMWFSGFVAEEIVFNLPFIRVWEASVDFHKATKAIKNEIITKFSEPGEAQKYIFIDQEVLGLADKESPYIVYETIKRCVELRQAAYDLISKNRKLVEMLAQELLDKKSMTVDEVITFLDGISTGSKESDTSKETVIV